MPQGHVYILELEGGHFYVGHSMDVETGIAAHFLGNGAGAVWTNLHKPLRVLSGHPGRRSSRERYHNRAHGATRS